MRMIPNSRDIFVLNTEKLFHAIFDFDLTGKGLIKFFQHPKTNFHPLSVLFFSFINTSDNFLTNTSRNSPTSYLKSAQIASPTASFKEICIRKTNHSDEVNKFCIAMPSSSATSSSCFAASQSFFCSILTFLNIPS